MMTKLSILVALTTLAIGAQAQFSELPPCGATCAQNSATAASGCASSDVNCMCNSQPYVDAVYSCIAGACDYGDQSSTIGHLGQICAAAANDPAPAPSSTTSSSSALAGVSTTSSSSVAAGASTTASGTGAPVSTTAAPVAFTHTPSEVAAALSASTSVTTAAVGGATTGAPRAATTQSQSTRVVVKTVGGTDDADAASSTGTTGNNILNGNGGASMGVDVMFTGVVAFVGAFLAL